MRRGRRLGELRTARLEVAHGHHALRVTADMRHHIGRGLVHVDALPPGQSRERGDGGVGESGVGFGAVHGHIEVAHHVRLPGECLAHRLGAFDQEPSAAFTVFAGGEVGGAAYTFRFHIGHHSCINRHTPTLPPARGNRTLPRHPPVFRELPASVQRAATEYRAESQRRQSAITPTLITLRAYALSRAMHRPAAGPSLPID